MTLSDALAAIPTVPETVAPPAGAAIETTGGVLSTIGVAAASTIAISSTVSEPLPSRASPKLSPLKEFGIGGVTQVAWVHEEAAVKVGLAVQYENAYWLSLEKTVKKGDTVDWYQVESRYWCPGVTVGVQWPRSCRTSNLLSPSV